MARPIQLFESSTTPFLILPEDESSTGLAKQPVILQQQISLNSLAPATAGHFSSIGSSIRNSASSSYSRHSAVNEGLEAGIGRFLKPSATKVVLKTFEDYRTLNRKVADLRNRLSSASALTNQEKIGLLVDIELNIRKIRAHNRKIVYPRHLRQLYAVTIAERNRLELEQCGQLGWPILSDGIETDRTQADTLFKGIAEAAHGAAQRHTTFPPESILTTANRIMPRVLETGDDIGPASSYLIGRATKEVRMQTYLYYEKSESARWLHLGLYQLHERQLEARKKNQPVQPIEVNITLDNSRGLAAQNFPGHGGRHQGHSFTKNRDQVSRKNTISNYGIGYPAKLDPSLVKVNVSGLTHHRRGTLHTKTLWVDGTAIVATNNYKGTHHKASMDDEPRYDAAIVMKGEVAKTIYQDHEGIANSKNAEPIGSNSDESAWSESNREDFCLPKKNYPAVMRRKNLTYEEYDRQEEEFNLDILKNIEIKHSIDTFFDSPQPAADDAQVPVVVLSKPPVNEIKTAAPDSPQREAYLHAFREARDVVRITNVNLNEPEVREEMRKMLARGVRLEILLPDDSGEIESALDAQSNLRTYHDLQNYANENGYSEQLDLRWQANLKGNLPNSDGQNHVKFMNVDGVAFIGSTNLDIQSWRNSAEISVVTADPETVNMLTLSCFKNLFSLGIPFQARSIEG